MTPHLTLTWTRSLSTLMVSAHAWGEVADALEVLTHRLGKSGECHETEDTGSNATVSLDLLDRAKDSEHELTLLSGYACAMAEGKASTDHESGIYCAASLVTERAAQIIAELVDVATTINQTER